ncbi:hypothetical protein DFS34DRAFT_589226 [Phlyctochytrium arcticum]|nr:hypothetical protein DFS34DRAFT_589226 [Phlyctochytrium arcticum]
MLSLANSHGPIAAPKLPMTAENSHSLFSKTTCGPTKHISRSTVINGDLSGNDSVDNFGENAQGKWETLAQAALDRFESSAVPYRTSPKSSVPPVNEVIEGFFAPRTKRIKTSDRDDSHPTSAPFPNSLNCHVNLSDQCKIAVASGKTRPRPKVNIAAPAWPRSAFARSAPGSVLPKGRDTLGKLQIDHADLARLLRALYRDVFVTPGCENLLNDLTSPNSCGRRPSYESSSTVYSPIGRAQELVMEDLELWLADWNNDQQDIVDDDLIPDGFADEFCDYSLDPDELANFLAVKKGRHRMIVGNVGSGKTSMIYHVACRAGYNVIEINSGCRRNYREVMNILEEATQTRALRSRKEGSSQNVFTTSDHRNYDLSSQSQLLGNLILLEEVDILFEDDKGFWKAVLDLLQKARCPVIFTSNSDPFGNANPSLPPAMVPHLQRHIIPLTLPAPKLQELACSVQIDLLRKGVWVDPSEVLRWSYHCHGDIRKCLTQVPLTPATSTRTVTWSPSATESQPMDRYFKVIPDPQMPPEGQMTFIVSHIVDQQAQSACCSPYMAAAVPPSENTPSNSFEELRSLQQLSKYASLHSECPNLPEWTLAELSEPDMFEPHTSGPTADILYNACPTISSRSRAGYYWHSWPDPGHDDEHESQTDLKTIMYVLTRFDWVTLTQTLRQVYGINTKPFGYERGFPPELERDSSLSCCHESSGSNSGFHAPSMRIFSTIK